MKKVYNNGFMLIETLAVTIFTSSVLLFLFIQISNLNKSYDNSFSYNTVDDLYALDDIINYINSDETLLSYIDNHINDADYIDITDCSLFENQMFCQKLIEQERINQIFIAKNNINYLNITGYTGKFNSFIQKIKKEGNEKYRVVASFNNGTYATLRFGE